MDILNSIEKVLYQVIYFGFSAHPSGVHEFTTSFSGVHVAQSLVVCSVFFTIVVSVVYSVLPVKVSDYPFDIFKTFFCVQRSPQIW